MKKRECPMCGVESKRIATSRHRPICSNLDCGLPVALWPSVGAGMICASFVQHLDVEDITDTDIDWAARLKLFRPAARRALRGGKR